MPIFASSNYVPASAGIPYLMEDVYLKGGFRTVTDTAQRDSIHIAARKPGMRVYVQSTDTTYTLNLGQLTTWIEVKESNVRGVYEYTPSSNIVSGGQLDFTVPSGKTAVILNVESTLVDIEIQAHSVAARSDVNPYKFISYAGHLSDDGSTKLEDGNIEFNRRYAMLANLEETPTVNSYWRLINKGTSDVLPTITITYLTIEG